MIEDDDSFGFLASRITNVLCSSGKAIFVEDIEGQHLEIKAVSRGMLKIQPGSEGIDALAGLGLRDALLFGAATDLEEVDTVADSSFKHGFVDGLNVPS